MTQFCKIDSSTNFVLDVIISTSADWCTNNYGGDWVEVKETHNIPNVDWIWDSTIDNFYRQRPSSNFTLNSETATWEISTPRPDDGVDREWSEQYSKWIRSNPNGKRTGSEPSLDVEKQNDEFSYEYDFDNSTWVRVKYVYDPDTDTWTNTL